MVSIIGEKYKPLMKKKLFGQMVQEEQGQSEFSDMDIIKFIDKRKEENNALKKILSNLKSSAKEGKSKKDK